MLGISKRTARGSTQTDNASGHWLRPGCLCLDSEEPKREQLPYHAAAAAVGVETTAFRVRATRGRGGGQGEDRLPLLSDGLGLMLGCCCPTGSSRWCISGHTGTWSELRRGPTSTLTRREKWSHFNRLGAATHLPDRYQETPQSTLALAG
eukprot:2161878-Rhodomonas_salina.2